jgi:hypothetical protein
MAKNVNANASPNAPSEVDQLKARLAEIKAEERKAREKARAKREEARAAREKEEAETSALRKQIEAELAEAKKEMDDAKAAYDAAKAKLQGVRSRLPKGGAGNRTPRDPNRLSKVQLRILVWLHGRKSASRQEMVDAGTGKTGGTMDASAIGSLDPTTRSPYSLLGRGYLEVEEVEVNDRKVYAYSLTADGRKATKAARASQASASA